MRIALIAAATLLAFGTAHAAGTPAQIERIGLQLFYLNSGTLSEDISPPSEFIAWNTIIGEGSAKEPADDALVTVHLRSTPGIGKFGTVKIVAKDGRGKIVGQRVAEPALTDENGRAAVALWLHDVGCAGKLTITATSNLAPDKGKNIRKISKSTVVYLHCGE